MTQRRPRIKDAAHLKFIRQLPCLVCGNDIQTEAAHVSYADPKYDKRSRGLGEKADDWAVVPLCGKCHRDQHDCGNEQEWWWTHSFNAIDPLRYTAALYLKSGDHEAGTRIVEANRP